MKNMRSASRVKKDENQRDNMMGKVTWKKGFEPKVLIDRLDEIRTVKNGQVSFRGFEYREYISVFKSLIDLGQPGIPASEAGRLVSRGVSAAARKPDFTQKNIITEVSRLVREYNSENLKRYTLVTTVNIKRTNHFPDQKINDVHVRFVKNLHKKYLKARKETARRVSSWGIEEVDTSKAYYVLAHTSARTPQEAVERIFEGLDLLRGIWCLKLNYDWVETYGLKNPVNQIVFGKLHTLHTSSGKQADDRFWYDPDPVSEKRLIDFRQRFPVIEKYTKRIRRVLAKHKYRDDVELAIKKFVRALDSRDYNASFLKLWSTLEFITGTQKANYDLTIRRAAFCFDDTAYCKLVLEHLRQYRNRFVHTGVGEDDIEPQVYQLQRFVIQVIGFHLTNPFQFESMDVATQFLDLPSDNSKIRQEISLRRKALKYRTVSDE